MNPSMNAALRLLSALALGVFVAWPFSTRAAPLLSGAENSWIVGYPETVLPGLEESEILRYRRANLDLGALLSAVPHQVFELNLFSDAYFEVEHSEMLQVLDGEATLWSGKLLEQNSDQGVVGIGIAGTGASVYVNADSGIFRVAPDPLEVNQYWVVQVAAPEIADACNEMLIEHDTSLNPEHVPSGTQEASIFQTSPSGASSPLGGAEPAPYPRLRVGVAVFVSRDVNFEKAKRDTLAAFASMFSLYEAHGFNKAAQNAQSGYPDITRTSDRTGHDQSWRIIPTLIEQAPIGDRCGELEVALDYASQFRTDAWQRPNLDADIAVFLVGCGRPTGTLGIAPTPIGIDTLPNGNRAASYLALKHGGMTDYSVLPHELGHILGMRHQWSVDITCDPYCFAHPIRVDREDKFRRSLMWSYASSRQMFRYSDPNIVSSFYGPLGDAKMKDNARVVVESFPKVVNYDQ